MQNDRRSFLKLGAAALAALPPSLRQALAMPMAPRTGTIKDVEHVVILMQENRSFDHYFGTLRGVRGFSDPRAITLPGGKPVWRQPRTPGDAETVSPFHLDTKTTYAQGMKSLDHSWKKSHRLWQNHDAWIAVKGEMTMGYFTRDDIPFYHALADAFTICDAYHCSIFGPTTPNRLFLFSGTSGLSVGNNGNQVIANPADEENETAPAANDSEGFASFGWTTYAERLQAAGIDWRVYQEFDNYGDNALAYFTNFRGSAASPDLLARGRGCVAGSNADNAKTSRGEHLVAAFAKDVQADRLPQVSWIVAPYILCEHPTATPGYGETFVSHLLEALAANPEVWAKTAFILNYDENDGFFDHVPPPVPAILTTVGIGISTVDTTAESYQLEPVGFGPRVPLIVVSPWTRRGFVNSQLCDHTSVIRFLEQRFGVLEPNISPWRRAVSGDLTSMFDFAQTAPWPALPQGAGAMDKADAQAKLPKARPVVEKDLPRQEPGQRPARSLPYDFDVTLTPAAGYAMMTFENRGAAGATFIANIAFPGEWPRFYTVESGKTIVKNLAESVDISVHGSNGFYRRFAGSGLTVTSRHDAAPQQLVLTLRNDTDKPAGLEVFDGYSGLAVSYTLAAGGSCEHRQGLEHNHHWYDITVRRLDDAGVVRHLAGHIETGQPSWSDPLIGRV